MSKSRKLFADAKKIMPSGVNSPVRYYTPYPFFVTKANASTIWDADHKQYIDFCNGYGALLLGHRHKQIINAVKKQLSLGTLYCAPTEQETQLCRLIKNNFRSMNKIRLVNTGSEATMTAIRLARGFTGKKKIVKFEGCYHGAHDSVLVKAGSGAAATTTHHGISASNGSLPEISKNTLVVPYNNIQEFEKTITKHSADTAGVIIEPILANMGLVLPHKNFLHDIQKITKRHNIPLIFDEIVTGFRISPGGAQKFFGITPDITTLAKALGNGFAIAAVGGRQDILDQLAPNGSVYQASTFAGNPIAVSAAISSIQTMNKLENTLYPKLERYCARLCRALDDIATDLHIAHQINFTSSMLQIFFSDKPVIDYHTSKAANPQKFQKMFRSLLRQGVFIAPSQFETVFLSYAHTTTDLNRAVSAYETALRTVKKT